MQNHFKIWQTMCESDANKQTVQMPGICFLLIHLMPLLINIQIVKENEYKWENKQTKQRTTTTTWRQRISKALAMSWCTDSRDNVY